MQWGHACPSPLRAVLGSAGGGACPTCSNQSSMPVAAFSTEVLEQPEYPSAASLEPAFLRPRQEFCRNCTCCAPSPQGRAGREWEGLPLPREWGPGVSPHPQLPPSPPRKQTASPSLRSTSHQLLPQGSGVQVQVRPGGAGRAEADTNGTRRESILGSSGPPAWQGQV